MLGLGVVLQSSALLFTLVKVAGAAYLLYIGLRHLLGRSNIAPPPEQAAQQAPRRASRLYLEAALVATMNPKPILFFTALFPQFLNASEPLLPQFLILTGIFMACRWSRCWPMARWPIARAALRQPRIVTWLNRLVGSIFVSFGVALLRLKRAAGWMRADGRRLGLGPTGNRGRDEAPH